MCHLSCSADEDITPVVYAGEDQPVTMTTGSGESALITPTAIISGDAGGNVNMSLSDAMEKKSSLRQRKKQ